MSQRISEKMLEGRIKYLNELTGNPTEYSRKAGDGWQQNEGHYCLSMAYGGYKLEQLGERGSRDISTQGYDTKRKLWDWINAYIDGIRTEREANNG